VWEPALAEHGAVLWAERRRWVAGAADAFAALCAAIGERAPVRMRYATALGRPTRPTGRDAPRDAAALAPVRDALAARSPRSARSTYGVAPRTPGRIATTSRSPSAGATSASTARAGSSAPRPSPCACSRRRRCATPSAGRPLFLLDDPFAELDARRAHRILGLLDEAGIGQAILAVPRAADIPSELTRLERVTVRDGAVGALGAD
jgi:recombinational DNA repair ATPase RecF